MIFTRGTLRHDNPCLVETLTRLEPESRQRVAVFIDRGVEAAHPHVMADLPSYFGLHGDRVRLAGTPEGVPGGEVAKNTPSLLTHLQHRLVALGVDRHSVVMAIGGGAVLDLVGFAAATVHRGVRLVRLPTTVLAQNDGGVGVKNGVNAFGVKNLLGAFAPPFAVINDFDFLATLDPRDRRAGLAEAVKVALIRDRAFFDWLEARATELAAFEAGCTEYMIRRSAELHLEHIAAGDPFEYGSKRPLDFGHWVAHKLESRGGYALRHGEAVAIGMALDCHYAAMAGLLAEPVADRVCALLRRLGFVLWDDGLLDDATIADGLREFREHMGGKLTVVLLRGVGDPLAVDALDGTILRRAVKRLHDGRERHAA